MNVKSLKLSDPMFPERLRNIPQPPKVLFVLSNNFEKLLNLPALAVVGSRKPTNYGVEITTLLAKKACRSGQIIVSGLAYGIDTIAHQVALDEHCPTIAVMPCGLDKVYPARHRHIARQILEQGGALVSEYPIGSPTYPSNFVARNRLIAGLADNLLITEAATKSGSLHTADFAMDQGKDIYAVPGPINNPNSTGTNKLIADGAFIVTSADSVPFIGHPQMSQVNLLAKLEDPLQRTILGLIADGVSSIGNLQAATSLPMPILLNHLTSLELGDYIEATGNNAWRLL